MRVSCRGLCLFRRLRHNVAPLFFPGMFWSYPVTVPRLGQDAPWRVAVSVGGSCVMFSTVGLCRDSPPPLSRVSAAHSPVPPPPWRDSSGGYPFHDCGFGGIRDYKVSTQVDAAPPPPRILGSLAAIFPCLLSGAGQGAVLKCFSGKCHRESSENQPSKKKMRAGKSKTMNCKIGLREFLFIYLCS